MEKNLFIAVSPFLFLGIVYHPIFSLASGQKMVRSANERCGIKKDPSFDRSFTCVA